MILTHLVMFGFWTGAGAPAEPVVASTALPAGGIGHGKKDRKRRRRIMLPDGRVITPRSDAEYRAIVSAIISAVPIVTAPLNRKARKRLKGAVVAPKPIRLEPVQALPTAFYDALAETHRSVLYHTQVLQAWEAFLAETDDEDAIAVLM